MRNPEHIKLILIIVALALLFATFFSILPILTDPDRTGATSRPAFDYSNCQYPDRTTNPVGGCDNSDPCDPGNVKGGSGACIELEPAAPIELVPFEGK